MLTRRGFLLGTGTAAVTAAPWRLARGQDARFLDIHTSTRIKPEHVGKWAPPPLHKHARYRMTQYPIMAATLDRSAPGDRQYFHDVLTDLAYRTLRREGADTRPDAMQVQMARMVDIQVVRQERIATRSSFRSTAMATPITFGGPIGELTLGETFSYEGAYFDALHEGFVEIAFASTAFLEASAIIGTGAAQLMQMILNAEIIGAVGIVSASGLVAIMAFTSLGLFALGVELALIVVRKDPIFLSPKVTITLGTPVGVASPFSGYGGPTGMPPSITDPSIVVSPMVDVVPELSLDLSVVDPGLGDASGIGAGADCGDACGDF